MRQFISLLVVLSFCSQSFAVQCGGIFSFKNPIKSIKTSKQAQFKARLIDFKREAMDYPRLISEASKVLGIEPKKLVQRLALVNVSPSELSREVDIQSSNQKDAGLELAMSPSKTSRFISKFKQKLNFLKDADGNFDLKNKIQNQIKMRQLTDPNFVRNFAEMASMHSGAQAIAHMLAFDFGAIGILSAQLTALLITEVALTFSSAKTLAYLIANKNKVKEARESLDQLKPNEQVKFFKFSDRLKLMVKSISLKSVYENTKSSIPNMAKVAFSTSLIPFTILAMGKTDGLADVASLALVNAGFHTAFIAMWAKLRYELTYGQLFPAIKNSRLTGGNVKTERYLIRTIMALNMVIASVTYSLGSDFTYEMFGKDFE